MYQAAPGESNWKQVYWGDHYARLEQIKKKVDPDMVFWCSPCVGADFMSYDDERLCKSTPATGLSPAPQTYFNGTSKTGIASLPGSPGIPEPLTPIVTELLTSKKLPAQAPKSSYFKIAMVCFMFPFELYLLTPN
jgi:hypothetical protein